MFGCERLKLLCLTPSSKLIFVSQLDWKFYENIPWSCIYLRDTTNIILLLILNTCFQLHTSQKVKFLFLFSSQIWVLESQLHPLICTVMKPSFQDFKPLPLSGNYLQFQLSLLHWMFPSFQYYKQWSLEEELQTSG